jgi:predicted Rossmann-fold nucleotide-binding protein
VDYWKGLFEWVEDKMLKTEHNISPDDLNLFRVVDTPDEAVEHIFRFYEKYVLKPNF